MMPSEIQKLDLALRGFSENNQMVGKGPLSVALILTRRAATMGRPLCPKEFLTPKGGQVAGLSGSNIQTILRDYGISRILSEEGGRTSRGSMSRMQVYLEFLNELDLDGLLDFAAIEAWWIDRVREFFSSQPLRLKVDSSKSLRSIISELVEAAFERQKECPGTMVAGAVLQHLVGAKLEMVMPGHTNPHEGFSVAAAPGKRKGDFLINDTVIHVTTAPSEALIRKCVNNLSENMRPLIITTETGVGGAKALAKNFEIVDRMDILDIEQFVATNIYEWSDFRHEERPASIHKLVDGYNRIIEACESDPSLKIELG